MDGHADALDGLDGGPACRTQEVEADYPVAVDVGVNGNGAWGGGRGDKEEADFGCFCGEVLVHAKMDGRRFTYGVILGEEKGETVGLVGVDGVRVKDLDVHLPFSEVIGVDEHNSGWEFLLRLVYVSGCESGDAHMS